MSEEKRDPHTLYGIEEKTYTRGVWEVDIELIEEWLREVDDDTYDQIGAAIEILGEHGPGLGTAGGLDRRVPTQEHEGTPTGLGWPE